MRTLDICLYVAAAVCFLIAAANPPIPRINLIALGLLLWILIPTITLARN